MKFLENKIPLYNMEHIFFTHSHLDHVDADQIMLRYPKYNKTSPLKPLKIYGNQSVLERFQHDEKRQERIEKTKLEFQKVIPYKKIEADELQCWPIIVDHDNREECFNYIFKYNGKNIYIGYDQKSMPEESFEFLSEFKLDIAVFEGTLGDSKPASTHMTFAEMVQLKDSLASAGSITPETKCYATHFSHHMKYTHEQLEKRLEPEEIIPAYDGLTIDI
jgi:L-ascorbate metabolism protein UlaG (beta-lactamase superfamily)